MVDQKIANELYRGVATSKPSNAEVVVCVKHVVAALGAQHPCSRNLKALAASWTGERATHSADQPLRRQITRSLGDLPSAPGLDPDCPVSGEVVLRSADYVALPRKALLAALVKSLRTEATPAKSASVPEAKPQK